MEIRQAISMYLTAKAYKDADFKAKFENPKKNLDECVTYITYKMYCKVKDAEENQQMAVCIPSDDEIFALAEQYYLDEDLKVDGSELTDMRIISLSATSFTEEEKATMRQDAIKKYQDGVIADMKKRDAERKAKTQKSKEKKPTSPTIIPNTTANDSKEPAKREEETAEDKPKAIQMDLFG